MTLAGIAADLRLSERDLLQMKLDIYALQRQTSEWHMRFSVGGNVITCFIESPSAERALTQGRDRALEMFKAWASSVRMHVCELVNKHCPTTRMSFNQVDDVLVEVSYSYGMGSTLACTFIGEEAKWHV